MSLVRTRRFALAVWWLSHGLRYCETSAVDNPNSCDFIFDDPTDFERTLTAQFFENTGLQHYLVCRGRLARSLHVAKTSLDRRCSTLPPARTGSPE